MLLYFEYSDHSMGNVDMNCINLNRSLCFSNPSTNTMSLLYSINLHSSSCISFTPFSEVWARNSRQFPQATPECLSGIEISWETKDCLKGFPRFCKLLLHGHLEKLEIIEFCSSEGNMSGESVKNILPVHQILTFKQPGFFFLKKQIQSIGVCRLNHSLFYETSLA